MNESTRESGVATGLRITFAILGAICIMTGAICGALNATVFNDGFWVNIVKSDDFKEYLMDEIGVENNAFSLENDPSIVLNFDNKNAKEDFVDLLLDDVLKIILEGEADVDRDAYEDFFNEYEDDLFDGMDLTSSQQREIVDTFLDDLEEYLDDYADEYEDSEAMNTLRSFEIISHSFFVMTVISVIVVAVFTIVLLVIHKNKFRPIRAMGIATAVAGFLNFVVALFLSAVFSSARSELTRGDDLAKILFNTLQGHFAKIVLVMAAVLVAGIVLTIVGAVGASSYNKSHME